VMATWSNPAMGTPEYWHRGLTPAGFKGYH
jgi:hypothetical protein